MLLYSLENCLVVNLDESSLTENYQLDSGFGMIWITIDRQEDASWVRTFISSAECTRYL